MEYGGEDEEFDETSVDAGEDTGRRSELAHRVSGNTDDLAAQFEHGHHGQSPQAEEDQK
jgi:hypothetical protein